MADEDDPSDPRSDPDPGVGPPSADARRTPVASRGGESTTRRRLLAACSAGMAGLAGCTGLFGGGPAPVDAGPGNESAPGASTAVPEDVPGQEVVEDIVGDEEPTATPTRTATPTDTSTATATPPPRPPEETAAPIPPGDSLRVDEARTGLRVDADGYYTTFTARVTVENAGEIVFDRVEFRVDVDYDPPGGATRDGDSRRVASAYVERRTFGDETPETLSPSESATFVVGPDRLRFARDGRADASTDVDDFRLRLAFRRVEYRPTDTPTDGG
jgi:hypothetical protein